jgi:hypothetical protein
MAYIALKANACNDEIFENKQNLAVQINILDNKCNKALYQKNKCNLAQKENNIYDFASDIK